MPRGHLRFTGHFFPDTLITGKLLSDLDDLWQLPGEFSDRPLLADTTLSASVPEAAARSQNCSRRAAATARLDLSLLRDFQGIVDLDAKVSDCRLQLGMTKQKLNGPQVLRTLVDQRRLRSAHRMRAIR